MRPDVRRANEESLRFPCQHIDEQQFYLSQMEDERIKIIQNFKEDGHFHIPNIEFY